MKKILISAAIAFLSINAFASEPADDFKHLQSYTCIATVMRTPRTSWKIDSRFELNLFKNAAGLYKLKNLVGHVEFGHDSLHSGYYGVFVQKSILNSPNYRGRTYSNHISFELNSTAMGHYDSAGMWGNFVVNKSEEDSVDAHYVLKAGDHVGGTIDYTCTDM